jgi:hypothetical protein
MIPGDADRDAFEKYIATCHKERLMSVALTAPHHGSRNFFRDDEKDEPYLEALNIIDPQYVVILAPKQEESRHDHPHEDAVKIYADKVGDENVFHTGQNRHCYIFDIFQDGTSSKVQDDQGEIAKSYPIDDGDNDDKKGGSYTKRDKLTGISGNRYA